MQDPLRTDCFQSIKFYQPNTFKSFAFLFLNPFSWYRWFNTVKRPFFCIKCTNYQHVLYYTFYSRLRMMVETQRFVNLISSAVKSKFRWRNVQEVYSNEKWLRSKRGFHKWKGTCQHDNWSTGECHDVSTRNIPVIGIWESSCMAASRSNTVMKQINSWREKQWKLHLRLSDLL